MRRAWLWTAVLLALTVSGGVSYAAADYSITITVTDTSGSARSNLVVWASVDNQTLADNSYIGPDALDTNVQYGGADQPYLPRSTVLGIVVDSLGANESRQYTYTLGEDTPQTDFTFMAGDGGSVSTADAASLEPGGSDFSMKWAGYFDASKTGNIIYKQDSYELTSPSAGTVRGYVIGASNTEDLVPNAAGDYEGISGQTGCAAGSHYMCVDDTPGAPDGDTTRLETSSSSEQKDAYNLSAPSFGSEARITSVTVYFRVKIASETGYFTPYLRLGTSETTGTVQAHSNINYTDYSQTLARPGGGSWTAADIADLQVGIGMRTASGTGWAYVTQVYVQVAYMPAVYVEESGISTGVHSVELRRTGNTLELYREGQSRDSDTVTFNLADNSNPVVSLANGPVLYSNYSTISVAGSPVLSYDPVTIVSGTTLPDRSGQGNNGTVTWGSNPASVDISVGAMAIASIPGGAASAPSTTEPQAVPELAQPSGMFGGTAEPTNLPFYNLWYRLGQASRLNTYWVFLPVLAVVGLAAGLWAARKTGEPLLVAVALATVLAAGVPMGVVDFWMVLLFAVVAFGVMLLLRPRLT